MTRRIGWPLLLVALICWPMGSALADQEHEEGPDEAGIGQEPEEHPLKRVSRLMREVERSLLEAQIDGRTRDTQRRIIEGLDAEGKAIEAMEEAQRKLSQALDGQDRVIRELEELIRQAENST